MELELRVFGVKVRCSFGSANAFIHVDTKIFQFLFQLFYRFVLTYASTRNLEYNDIWTDKNSDHYISCM